MSNLSNCLRKARLHQGITLRKLGELTGICYVTISDIELGKSKHPTIQTIVAIADALGNS